MYIAIAAEQIEMGGIVDPERGALIYRKTTQVELVEPEVGSEFTQKKIKKVTSESTWLGQEQGQLPEKTPLVAEPAEQTEAKPWHDDEMESNPLYSSTDYTSGFHNPLYTNRQSTTEGDEFITYHDVVETGDDIPLVPGGKEKSRASRGRPGSDRSGGPGGSGDQGYMDYLSAQPGLDTVDTLF